MREPIHERRREVEGVPGQPAQAAGDAKAAAIKEVKAALKRAGVEASDAELEESYAIFAGEPLVDERRRVTRRAEPHQDGISSADKEVGGNGQEMIRETVGKWPFRSIKDVKPRAFPPDTEVQFKTKAGNRVVWRGTKGELKARLEEQDTKTMATALGISPVTIARTCAEVGLKLEKGSVSGFNPPSREALEAVLDLAGSAARLAKAVDASGQTVQRACEEWGIDLRARAAAPGDLWHPTKEALEAEIFAKGKSLAQVAREAGVDFRTLERRLEEHGIEVRKGAIDRIDKEAFARDMRENDNLTEVAAKHHVSRETAKGVARRLSIPEEEWAYTKKPDPLLRQMPDQLQQLVETRTLKEVGEMIGRSEAAVCNEMNRRGLWNPRAKRETGSPDEKIVQVNGSIYWNGVQVAVGREHEGKVVYVVPHPNGQDLDVFADKDHKELIRSTYVPFSDRNPVVRVDGLSLETRNRLLGMEAGDIEALCHDRLDGMATGAMAEKYGMLYDEMERILSENRISPNVLNIRIVEDYVDHHHPGAKVRLQEIVTSKQPDDNWLQRKVSPMGTITWRGKVRTVGKQYAGEPVEVFEDDAKGRLKMRDANKKAIKTIDMNKVKLPKVWPSGQFQYEGKIYFAGTNYAGKTIHPVKSVDEKSFDAYTDKAHTRFIKRFEVGEKIRPKANKSDAETAQMEEKHVTTNGTIWFNGEKKAVGRAYAGKTIFTKLSPDKKYIEIRDKNDTNAYPIETIPYSDDALKERKITRVKDEQASFKHEGKNYHLTKQQQKEIFSHIQDDKVYIKKVQDDLEVYTSRDAIEPILKIKLKENDVQKAKKKETNSFSMKSYAERGNKKEEVKHAIEDEGINTKGELRQRFPEIFKGSIDYLAKKYKEENETIEIDHPDGETLKKLMELNPADVRGIMDDRKDGDSVQKISDKTSLPYPVVGDILDKNNARPKVGNINDIQDYIDHHHPGAKVISDSYVNKKGKLKIICDNSEHPHEINMTPLSLKEGHWCRECFIEGNFRREKMVRELVERILDTHLPRAHPEWLLRPNKTKGLEIDCFTEHSQLTRKVAIEVNGEQHYKHIKHFHKRYEDFLRQKENDAFKRHEVRARDIAYVEVPYTVKDDDVEAYLRQAFERLGVRRKNMDKARK